MKRGIFITGTDTGVGKTFVASGLINSLKEKGTSVCPMKPIETGCKTRNGQLVPLDALRLIHAAGVSEPLDFVNPYRFRAPIAPAVAAEMEGRVIQKRKIISLYRRLSSRHDMVIVEGAGGIMVPVFRKYLFLDLIRDLDIPLVIVSRPGIGTINHTLLTVLAARNRGIDVRGIIINHATRPSKDVSLRTNPFIIERLSGRPILGIVPFLKGSHSNMIFRKIAEKI